MQCEQGGRAGGDTVAVRTRGKGGGDTVTQLQCEQGGGKGRAGRPQLQWEQRARGEGRTTHTVGPGRAKLPAPAMGKSLLRLCQPLQQLVLLRSLLHASQVLPPFLHPDVPAPLAHGLHCSPVVSAIDVVAHEEVVGVRAGAA